MSNKEELEKLITLLEPYSKDNQAIEKIIGTIELRIMKANVSDEEKDKIYADVTKVLSDSQIKTILDEFSKIKDEKIKEDKIKKLDENIKILQERKHGETDENKIKEIDSLLDIANFKRNVILKLPDPAVKPASVAASANPAAAVKPTASAKPAGSSAAVVVYVKIGADNSIEILDNIPPSATLTKSSFYDVIKNDITSDTYIAMDITETCSIMDDSCIQYNGIDYSMDLQNIGTGNQPLDMNFLKVKTSGTNASATNASATNASATNASSLLNKASSSAKEGEVEGEVEEVEGEEKEEVKEKEKEESEEEKKEKIKKIKEKEEINTEWEKFKDLVNGKLDSLKIAEERKDNIIQELQKIENEQIIPNIDKPNDLLKNIKKNTDSFNDDLKDYFDIIKYLEGMKLYFTLDEQDGGMSMNIFH